MSDENNLHYWEMRLEQALEYLSICGFRVVEDEMNEDIIVEDPRGNLYHHNAAEIIRFQDEGNTPTRRNQ